MKYVNFAVCWLIFLRFVGYFSEVCGAVVLLNEADLHTYYQACFCVLWFRMLHAKTIYVANLHIICIFRWDQQKQFYKILHCSKRIISSFIHIHVSPTVIKFTTKNWFNIKTAFFSVS